MANSDSVVAIKEVNVAVGVVINSEGLVLIALRQGHQHLAEHWEFPGGKIELGESVVQALARELKEEVGIDIKEAMPLTTIKQSYPNKNIILHVCRVEQFKGEARGLEGQQIQWVEPSQLSALKFPPANQEIIRLL